MSGFDSNWLQQREPFDNAARDRALARRFGATLDDAAANSAAPRRIIDLAAGSGANFRHLAPQLNGDQDWLLIDHDPLLLTAQGVQITQWAKAQGWPCVDEDGVLCLQARQGRWRVHARALDLAQSLERVDFGSCDGVTTAAFLDLVSTAWLERLAHLLAAQKKPLLAVLTVDGRRQWQPALPADAAINAAFQRHQLGDKGFGAAAGARATADCAERLMTLGYAVSTARSDWRITTADNAMLQQMVTEAAAVARSAEPADSVAIDAWLATRQSQIAASALALDIGHLDLLALPPHAAA